jgi:uncharacterized membrane protein
MKSRYNPDNFNRLEKNPEHYKWGLFYYNPYDTRIIVPKRNQGMGWTLNFANLWSYVILAAIAGLALLIGVLADSGKI